MHYVCVLCCKYIFKKALAMILRSVSLVEEEHDLQDMAHYRNVVVMGWLLSFHHHNHASRSSLVPGQPQRSLPASSCL